MNVNLLITDYDFTVTNISSIPSKPDQSNKGVKFSLNSDDKHSQVNNLEKPTTDNVGKEIQTRKEPVNESPHKLTQSIPQKTKSENTAKAENKTKLKEQITNSSTTKQPCKQNNLIQSRLAKNSLLIDSNSVTIEHSNSVTLTNVKQGTATKIVPKADQQLTQIITNSPAGKSSTVTGHAVKSAEIKLLHATEKGQLGIKTVLPAKSNGENGLKAVLPDTLKSTTAGKKQPETVNNTDKIPVSTKTIPETKPVMEKRITIESAPEIPTNTGKSTNVPTVKQTIENINPATIQAKIPEVQPQPTGTDAGKPAPTDQKDAKANASLKNPNLSNPNGKKALHTGNDIPENQSVQKLNTATVQVSTNQIKDRNISTSNKGTSQGVEQILPHNNSQTIITEQTPSAAKNTTRANMPSQNSSSDVPADIGKQILESVHRSISQQGVERQITVRLNPPELGKVFIKFQQHDNELTGFMEVSKNQTRFEIEQTLPQIIRNLVDSGIQIKRLEVMLSNEQQSGQGALGNQSLQSGGSQQQYSGNPGTSGNDMDVHQSNEWLASNNSYEGLSELQETLITDNSINLLI